jgi:hypothetical protein
MPDPPRDASGYRSYDDRHVRRLGLVMRGRDPGFSPNGIRGLLGLVDARSQTCAEVREIASAHLTDPCRHLGPEPDRGCAEPDGGPVRRHSDPRLPRDRRAAGLKAPAATKAGLPRGCPRL